MMIELNEKEICYIIRLMDEEHDRCTPSTKELDLYKLFISKLGELRTEISTSIPRYSTIVLEPNPLCLLWEEIDEGMISKKYDEVLPVPEISPLESMAAIMPKYFNRIMQCEYGANTPVRFNRTPLCNNNAENILCECGSLAQSVISGIDSNVARCNKCMGC